MKEALRALDEAREKLKTEKAVRESYEDELKHLRGLQKSTEELSQARRVLGEVSKNLDKTEKKLEKIKDRKDTLAKRTHTVNERCTRLASSKSKLKENNKSARAECNESNKDLTETQEKLCLLDQQRKDAGRDVERLHLQVKQQFEEARILRAHASWQHEEIQLLKSRIKILQENEASAQRQFEDERRAHTETKQLIERLTQEHSDSMRKELELFKKRENRLTQKTESLQKAGRRLYIYLWRANRKLADFQNYKTMVQKTLKFMEKGVYTPNVRSIVRRQVVLGCPMKNVGEVIDSLYQSMIKPLLDPQKRLIKIVLSPRTVAHIVAEGGVAADIQLALETYRTIGKMLCISRYD